VSHANAAVTPGARLKVARLVVEHWLPITEVAARFQVSWPTVGRCAVRYAAGESMGNNFSRRRPTSKPAATGRGIASLMRRCRGCPGQQITLRRRGRRLSAPRTPTVRSQR